MFKYFIKKRDSLFKRFYTRRMLKCCERGDYIQFVKAFFKLNEEDKREVLFKTDRNDVSIASVATRYDRDDILKYCLDYYIESNLLYTKEMFSITALETAVAYRSWKSIKCILFLLIAHDEYIICNECFW